VGIRIQVVQNITSINLQVTQNNMSINIQVAWLAQEKDVHVNIGAILATCYFQGSLLGLRDGINTFES
jgi:hypothetical protein